MPRIRTIKPEFWTDEKILSLSYEARLLFIGLWNFCDDQGFIDDSPFQIKIRIFPADDMNIAAGVAELIDAELVDVYETSQGRVLKVRHWEKHQKINRPMKPRFDESASLDGPIPVNQYRDIHGVLTEDSLSPHCTLTAEGREGKGKDQGKEGKGREARNRATGNHPTTYTDDFMAFWSVFPSERKKAKSDCAKKFAEAVKGGVTAETIIDAAGRYAADPNRTSEFTVNPYTWLREERWEAGPLPPRGGTQSASQSAWEADMRQLAMEPQASFPELEGGLS